MPGKHFFQVILAVLAVAASIGIQSRISEAIALEPLKNKVPVSNVVVLRENVGKVVTAFGRVSRTGKSGSGLQFLNFANSELTIVCASDDVRKFKLGQPADIYESKDIEVTGKVEVYKGKLQIRLRDPKQIEIADKPGETSAKRVTLKKIGRDAWISPAGLRYQGRDPQGLTRVEHIGRHVRDIPDRDGPHGVFDGDDAVAFAVIDEAWKLARQRRLRPNVEGDRSTYTVRMGRRVGFLGGELGAARRNPPLDRVFIVVETGTKSIITAFPK